MVMPRFSISLSLALSLLVGCSTPKEEVVGKPPAEVEQARNAQMAGRIQIEKEAPQRPTHHPEALALLPGWPLQEEGRRFTARWDAASTPVPLADIPSLNSIPVAEAIFQPGEIVRWTQSVVGVYRPKFYQAKAGTEVEGYLVTAEYRTGEEVFYTELNPKEQVIVYMYAGSGLCYMGIRGKIVEGLCPDPERFTGDFSQQDLAKRFHPPERIWWVFVGNPGQGGWLALDDRFVVDIE